MSLNYCVLMGRVTRDPELKHTPGGTAVCSFTLAVDRDFKKEDGSRDTDFIEVVTWRGTAEFVCRNFTKGRAMLVSGRLQIRAWQDKEGNRRQNAELAAENVYFADSKRETGAVEKHDNLDDLEEFEELEENGPLPF